MNFLRPPHPGIHPNADLDEIQWAVAKEFVEELIKLGTLQPPLPGRGPTITTAPMFVIPKEEQPGEWRVIADLKAGGQNEVVGGDPV